MINLNDRFRNNTRKHIESGRLKQMVQPSRRTLLDMVHQNLHPHHQERRNSISTNNATAAAAGVVVAVPWQFDFMYVDGLILRVMS